MPTKKKTTKTTKTKTTKTKTTKTKTTKTRPTGYAVRWVERDFQQTYVSGVSRPQALQLRAAIVKGMTATQAARVKIVAQ